MCIVLAALAALALASWTAVAPASGAEGEKEHHPHMRRAMHHLNQAKAELAAAKHDYSGHRAAALDDAQKAVEEIIAGLESDGWKGERTLAPASQPAPEEGKSHHEMRRALWHLRQAKTQLKDADHDYHGHRVEAIKFVDHSIRHVREGLKSVEGK